METFMETFSKIKKDDEPMSYHIANLETTSAKLDDVGQPLNELMQIAILLPSMRGDHTFEAVIKAIKAMHESNNGWNAFTTRLINE